MTRLFVGIDPTTGSLATHTEPDEPRLKVSDHGNSFIAYLLTDERDGTTVEWEVCVGEGDNVQCRTYTVDDMEPDDVWGPIFGRLLEAMGLWLDDPADYRLTDLSVHPNDIDRAYEVEIQSTFTETLTD